MEWITCENINQETWRRLLEYANNKLAIDKLIEVHGAPKSKADEKNYLKQASQIRVSLLQAKEYFTAAQHSSLITSPNHLYYGMLMLSCAIMLILGDGTKSLDYLRRDKKNQKHGLNFSIGINESQASNDLNILSGSHVEVAPFGFFKNWYEVLPKLIMAHGICKHKFSSGKESINWTDRYITIQHYGKE